MPLHLVLDQVEDQGAERERELHLALAQVDGDGRAGGPLAGVGRVGARDDEAEPVTLLEGVVLWKGLPLDRAVLPLGQRRGGAERVAVLHVDPAAGHDLQRTGGDVADDLLVAAVVGGRALAVAGLLGEGRDALAATPVDAAVLAEVDEQRGQVRGGLVEGDAQVHDGRAGQAQVRRQLTGGEGHPSWLLRADVGHHRVLGLADVGEGGRRVLLGREQAERAVRAGAQGELHPERGRPVALGGPAGGPGLHVGAGLVHDAVLHAEQPEVEPAVQRVDPQVAASLEVERVHVLVLPDPDLAGHVPVGQALPPGGEVVGLDVEVVDRVHDEDAGAHLGDVAQRARDVVPLGPEGVVVAGVVAVLGIQARPCRGALGDRVGVDDPRQVRHVVEVVDHAVGALVLVPGADRRDRDDGLEALDAGRRDGVGQRAVVGLSDHRGLAGGPVGDRRRAVLTVGGGAAVQPVDDGLAAQHVGPPADVGAPLGLGGADHVDVEHRVTARDEVVVVEQGELGEVPLRVVDLPLGLVAATGVVVVRALVDDHRHLEPGTRLLGPDDVDADTVQLPVGVTVDGGLDIDVLADGVGVGEDRLGPALLDGDGGFGTRLGRGDAHRADRDEAECDQYCA